jgi:hypothetical protein
MVSEAATPTQYEIPPAFGPARSLLPDEVIVIAWWESLDSHEITLRDYIHTDGRPFIPLFGDEETFDAHLGGRLPEKSKVVQIKSDLLISWLRGGERLAFSAKGRPSLWIDLPTL